MLRGTVYRKCVCYEGEEDQERARERKRGGREREREAYPCLLSSSGSDPSELELNARFLSSGKIFTLQTQHKQSELET